MTVQQIIKQINNNQSFLVVAHENPDGDAIGSTLALSLALREMGKNVVAYNTDTVPEAMFYLQGSELFTQELPNNAHFDVAFVLDSGEVERTGLPVEQLCETMINIDHHPHSTFGDICYLDTEASATAVLIYRILVESGHTISQDVAAALYLGILSDTGSFRYSSANEESFDIAGKLVALGIDPWDTASNLYESYAPERMRLLGIVLPSLNVSSCGRFATMFMTMQDLKTADALDEHADGFVNYPRAVRGVEVALFFNEVEKGQFKISLRSRGKIDVGNLARQLGGGGHHNAAGARISGPEDVAKKTVTDLLNQVLD
jgi:bifunctional oligoribonuclease and PAP phosphatase NrnA